MFVAYCVNVLKKAPTSIPGILSGLKNNLVLRFVPLDAFDNNLLVAMKAAVKRLPYSPRVRLPCTYTMVLYIIQQNTQQHGNKDQFMLAVGVGMAYYLCLRASEYASKTKTPDPESHQFDSKSVEFKCFHSSNLVPSSRMHSTCSACKKHQERAWRPYMVFNKGRQRRRNRLSTTCLLMVTHEHTAPRRPLSLVSYQLGYHPLPRIRHRSRRHCAVCHSIWFQPSMVQTAFAPHGCPNSTPRLWR